MKNSRTGKIFRCLKNDQLYKVISDNVRFKDSALNWIDAVAYAPLYLNKYDFFLKKKSLFDKDFIEVEIENGKNMKSNVLEIFCSTCSISDEGGKMPEECLSYPCERYRRFKDKLL